MVQRRLFVLAISYTILENVLGSPVVWSSSRLAHGLLNMEFVAKADVLPGTLMLQASCDVCIKASSGVARNPGRNAPSGNT